ncbi:thioesterase family protein [Mycobacterium avium subsp. hominissuis]|uniref:thioesterase family protein n=1 Tax=Mycobacterium avium TaxID=1764 RepID=UPI00039230AC|nr:thioesterase family protein [Mycobacterium avium]APA74584.1 thioesterase family protein [Mycobacterium avium subsp. hominissuis]ATO61550.2 thioesterase family protein [Mycobacterium avium subsp. hominissuis]ATO66102.1 thioesterase family protein [Mycobacterium avium subsp. hominissuis]ATO70687.1 thioesterase family protein [Mycobacterium avium subsp. hominissuis]PBJ41773.1 thioesterase family protein [Mycobacterium avium subsp. hominissuis]
MTDAYYELIDDATDLGEKFSATDLVISTWSTSIQHAGPVSALLVRALERCAPRLDTRLSRVVVDLLGPVPVSDQLWVSSRLERAGKKIELVNAELLALGPDGRHRSVARASGWRLQQTDTKDLTPAPTLPMRPVSQARRQDVARWDRNYLHSLDWRWLTDILASPGEAWIKPTVDLVKGETMTQLQQLFTVADNANGIGSKLAISQWRYLNNDLVVHLHRVPEGHWTGVRAETNYGPDGIATNVGTLFDERGPVGSIQQSILLRRLD